MDFGESDRVVTLFGRSTGKVSAMARGARRSRRRFGAALAPYVLGEASLRDGRGELMFLERFDAVRDFPSLAQDVAKLAHASYMTELVRELSPDHAAEARTFDLYAEALELLDGAPAAVELLRTFEMHLLEIVGIRPQLELCVRCGQGGPFAGFDPSAGVLCAGCGPAAIAFDESTRVEMRRRATIPLAQSGDPKLPKEMNAQARAAIVAFVEWHLGRPLRSVEVIARMMGTAR